MVSIVVWASRRRSKAIRLDAPKSMQKRMPGASTRMQVLKRPPEPNESPEPTKVTVVDMGVGFLAANDAHSRSPPVSLSQRRTKLTMKPVDGDDQDPGSASWPSSVQGGQDSITGACATRFHAPPKHGSSDARTIWVGGRAARLRSRAPRGRPRRTPPELGAGASASWEGSTHRSPLTQRYDVGNQNPDDAWSWPMREPARSRRALLTISPGRSAASGLAVASLKTLR